MFKKEDKTTKQLKNDKKRDNQRNARFKRNREKRESIKAKLEMLEINQSITADNCDVANYTKLSNEINELRRRL